LAAAAWIDMVSPSPEEIEAVRAATGLTAPTREALSEIENSSRLRAAPEGLYLSSPLLSGAETATAHLTPVGFILTPERLVTVRFDRLVTFDNVAAELAKTVGAPQSGPAVFANLIEAVVDRAADLLEFAGAEIERLSHRAFKAEHPNKTDGKDASNVELRATLRRIGQIGGRLSHIRGVLLGIGRICPFATELGSVHLGPDLVHRLSAARQDVISLDDYEAHLANKLQFLLDAVLGLISAEQNDLFKILTIVSVVGVPPTLAASIWGMNFKHMPELDWPLGYPIALLVIVISTILPVVWFKWKRWW
jgi:magnesium transporter